MFIMTTITMKTTYAFTHNSALRPTLGRTRWNSLLAVQARNRHTRESSSLPRVDDDDADEGGRNALVIGRRTAMRGAISSAAVGLGVLSGFTGTVSSGNAFDKTFPQELTETDEQQATPLYLDNRRYSQGSRSNSVQRAYEAASTKQKMKNNVVNFNVKNDLLPSLVWGGALWLLSGSRSNPIATPLANVIYDEKEEDWLRDRNDGLFAALPIPLLCLLGFVFAVAGAATQYTLLQLSQGDADYTSQLAGVSLIAGGFLELGRIASGEKKETREENDRAEQLEEEFQEFASKRLTIGNTCNCHRSDIVSAFRRFYGKYRQADSEEYPLTDLEIEQLLRSWNRGYNGGRAEMTSSGFYYGIEINKDADVFVQS